MLSRAWCSDGVLWLDAAKIETFLRHSKGCAGISRLKKTALGCAGARRCVCVYYDNLILSDGGLAKWRKPSGVLSKFNFVTNGVALRSDCCLFVCFAGALESPHQTRDVCLRCPLVVALEKARPTKLKRISYFEV